MAMKQARLRYCLVLDLLHSSISDRNDLEYISGSVYFELITQRSEEALAQLHRQSEAWR
jgi:hypothetical protein